MKQPTQVIVQMQDGKVRYVNCQIYSANDLSLVKTLLSTTTSDWVDS